MGAQEPEVAKEAPRRRAGIAHAEEVAATLSVEDLEHLPGRAPAPVSSPQLPAARSSPPARRCESAGSRVEVEDRDVSVCRSDRVSEALQQQGPRGELVRGPGRPERKAVLR